MPSALYMMDGGARCAAVRLQDVFAFVHSSPCVRSLPRATEGPAKCLAWRQAHPCSLELALGLREAGKPQPGDKGAREVQLCKIQESLRADLVIFCQCPG